MVVRNMIYDALNYGDQVRKMAAIHREQKDTRGAEFLSGFRKTDRLKPVITLTLYWGAKSCCSTPAAAFQLFPITFYDLLFFLRLSSRDTIRMTAAAASSVT
jgi:muramidase (phage lysozyme)